jgi:hypothetical protein
MILNRVLDAKGFLLGHYFLNRVENGLLESRVVQHAGFLQRQQLFPEYSGSLIQVFHSLFDLNFPSPVPSPLPRSAGSHTHKNPASGPENLWDSWGQTVLSIEQPWEPYREIRNVYRACQCLTVKGRLIPFINMLVPAQEWP